MTSELLALGLPGPFELLITLAVLGFPLVVIAIVVWFVRRPPGGGAAGTH